MVYDRDKPVATGPPEKMDRRWRECVVVGYAPLRPYFLFDIEIFLTQGRYLLRVTRGTGVLQNQFPVPRSNAHLAVKNSRLAAGRFAMMMMVMMTTAEDASYCRPSRRNWGTDAWRRRAACPWRSSDVCATVPAAASMCFRNAKGGHSAGRRCRVSRCQGHLVPRRSSSLGLRSHLDRRHSSLGRLGTLCRLCISTPTTAPRSRGGLQHREQPPWGPSGGRGSAAYSPATGAAARHRGGPGRGCLSTSPIRQHSRGGGRGRGRRDTRCAPTDDDTALYFETGPITCSPIPISDGTTGELHTTFNHCARITSLYGIFIIRA